MTQSQSNQRKKKKNSTKFSYKVKIRVIQLYQSIEHHFLQTLPQQLFYVYLTTPTKAQNKFFCWGGVNENEKKCKKINRIKTM